MTGSNLGSGSGQTGGLVYGRTSPGHTRINSGAFNFSDVYGKKQNITFRTTYNGGLTLSDVETRSLIQNFQTNGTFFNNNQNLSNNRVQDHQLDAEINYQDSLLSISFYPSINIVATNSTVVTTTSTANAVGQLINNGYQKTGNDQTKTDISGALYISRKFRQKK